ncbi:GNAT family N-acetyltransferase [Macrococcus animalis]|uniref:GNAT family N-acetyltransferase n=1 Tax=Macrococcus animalis TaxID=3395467 RepID=UPI0039BDAF00
MNLKRANVNDAKIIWEMQVRSFQSLLDKYEDYETSPANEDVELIHRRLEQPFTYYYFIYHDNEIAGAIRIVDKYDESPKRISPIFILPEYRNLGLAQSAIEAVENIHGSTNWMLNTILEEKGNCYLYEKLGYEKFGELNQINDRLTLVTYRK